MSSDFPTGFKMDSGDMSISHKDEYYIYVYLYNYI